jgi:hypothetical protein
MLNIIFICLNCLQDIKTDIKLVMLKDFEIN